MLVRTSTSSSPSPRLRDLAVSSQHLQQMLQMAAMLPESGSPFAAPFGALGGAAGAGAGKFLDSRLSSMSASAGAGAVAGAGAGSGTGTGTATASAGAAAASGIPPNPFNMFSPGTGAGAGRAGIPLNPFRNAGMTQQLLSGIGGNSGAHVRCACSTYCSCRHEIARAESPSIIAGAHARTGECLSSLLLLTLAAVSLFHAEEILLSALDSSASPSISDRTSRHTRSHMRESCLN